MTTQLIQLGPYRIGRSIGKGGMGSVYEATDSTSGQRVAIKALSPHLAQVEGFRERFEAEIESLKTLRHEGIVRLYGYGEQDGVLFYSMEIINGPSLEDELKAGRRFNWREVTDIATQLCMALKHAHDHGIIHRDIKPANILFADERHVKLADFGIARLFGTNSSLTSAGGVLGTADYMSPEQADGRPVSARCDQYSLGGVMYALLAGRPPFRAKNLPEMLQLQRYADPEPVSRYAPDTPKQLEQVIAQLLAKDPADRFPNTQVLARHLQAMVRALSRPTPDGFSLAGDPIEQHLAPDDLGHSLAMAVTRDDPSTPLPSIRGSRTAPARQSNAEESPAPAADTDATLAEDVAPGTRYGQSLRAKPDGSEPVAGSSTPSTAVFTTVEEEYARQEHARPWTAILAPLVSLILFLSAVAGFGYYLSRPYSADALYAVIAKRATTDNVSAIRDVKSEIDEFVERFPDDERASELREYAQRIELDEMHRKLQNEARRKGIVESQLLPIELLYLGAMDQAATSPQRAIATLESLINLYGPNAGFATSDNESEKAEEIATRRAGCVALAQRQLVALREDVAELEARQTAAIEERLMMAERIAPNAPDAAREMYRAIVDLYGDDDWADDLVLEAKTKLNQLNEANE